MSEKKTRNDYPASIDASHTSPYELPIGDYFEVIDNELDYEVSNPRWDVSVAALENLRYKMAEEIENIDRHLEARL